MTNDKIRASVYYVAGMVLYGLGLVQVWHAISSGGDIAAAVTGLGTMVTGSAPSYAGYKTTKQINDGTLGSSPAEKAIKAVQDAQAVKDAAEAAAAQAAEDFQKVMDSVSALLPSKADKLSYDINVNSVDDALKAAQALDARSLSQQVLAINARR